MHCTPMLDAMVDNPGTRPFIGITPSVEILAGVLLSVGLASSLMVLAMVSKSSGGGFLELYNGDSIYYLLIL